MGIRDLERMVHDELQKSGIKLPGSVTKWEYHPMIQRIAKAAWDAGQAGRMGGGYFREIARKWYRDQQAKGFFRNDFREEKPKSHSFWSFAYHLDHEWAIGITRKSPWTRMMQWIRKVRYNINKKLKHK